MEPFLELLKQSGFANLSSGNIVMFVVAGVLVYLAVAKGYEPMLLIPVGFGAVGVDRVVGVIFVRGVPLHLLLSLSLSLYLYLSLSFSFSFLFATIREGKKAFIA